MMSQSNQALTVASFYSFSRLSNLKARRVKLLTLCNSLRLRGTLLLAEEGVNGTISGRQNQVESLVSHLRSWPEMNDFEVKYSTSLEQNFNRMKVKIKDEIVTMGEPYIDAATDSGQYVDPKDWNQLISRDDVLIVDTRNTYEVSMGRFDGATNPSLEKFRDFPSWAAALSRDVDKSTAVAMYCTGGIRCEKATTFMKKIGFDEVYHLRGGILKYLEEISEEESLWEGECFVFDDRVGLKHGLIEGTYTLCYGCQQPISVADRESSVYEEGVSCPNCFDSLSEDKQERIRERQRQVTLSLSRGEEHLGDEAMARKQMKLISKQGSGV